MSNFSTSLISFVEQGRKHIPFCASLCESCPCHHRGGPADGPRGVVENPAVTPEMVNQAPEDLRDDLMPKQKDQEPWTKGNLPSVE